MQQKHNKQHKPHSTFNSVKGLRHSLCQTGFVKKIQYTNKITEEMLIPGKKNFYFITKPAHIINLLTALSSFILRHKQIISSRT